MQRLIFNGKEMENDWTLAECNIQDKREMPAETLTDITFYMILKISKKIHSGITKLILQESKTRVIIEDNEQLYSSSETFNSKYTTGNVIFESENTIVFAGEDKLSQLPVAIKLIKVEDYQYIRYLKGNIPEEFLVQKIADKVNVQNGKGTVLEVMDWYVYDDQIIIVTEYDEDFEDLYDCTTDNDNEHFSEKEGKVIFKLLFELVRELNGLGIFHLDLKPSNVLYNVINQEMKLIDFDLAISVNPGEFPLVSEDYGTEGLRTPQQVNKEECYGNDVDLWGVGQTLFFCLQGTYAFQDDNEVTSKELKFNIEVSENCRDLLTRMLAKNVEDRMSPEEILDHPWLRED